MNFELYSDYAPAGDQPQAIEKLVEGLGSGLAHQTLLGVTGSGKTFTIANVIQQVQIGLINLSGGARHANFAGSAAGEISIMRLSDCLPSLNAAGRSGQLRK